MILKKRNRFYSIPHLTVFTVFFRYIIKVTGEADLLRSATDNNPVQCVADNTSLGQGCTLDLPRRFTWTVAGFSPCPPQGTSSLTRPGFHPGPAQEFHSGPEQESYSCTLHKALPLQSAQRDAPLDSA